MSVIFSKYLPSFALVIAISITSLLIIHEIDLTYADNHMPFITTWNISVKGDSVVIPVGNNDGMYTVDWGDGSTTTVQGDARHTYDLPGTYTVKISGDFTQIHLGAGDPFNAEQLQSLDQWGTIRWSTMESAFKGASNMTYEATDVPDLSNVKDMSSMFFDAYSFNGDISSWDVSNVTDMSYMFFYAESFNQPLNDWDVSNVTNMSSMFANTVFNQPLDKWDVSNVTNMSSMFTINPEFNQPLNDWDVSNVTNMSLLFAVAESFNQPLNDWDVSNVTNMSYMFTHAHSFNQPLDKWDVSNVTDMSFMFTVARQFNQSLDSWDVSNVTNMFTMLAVTNSFNQSLNSWDVSNVTDMARMFNGANSFNQPLDKWDVSNVTDMNHMFMFADSFNQSLNSWDVSNVTDMSYMFTFDHTIDQSLGKWYIIPDNTVVSSDETLVTTIRAQNEFLDGQNPSYMVVQKGDGLLFEMRDNMLYYTMSEYTKSHYDITILSTNGFVPTSLRDITITVADRIDPLSDNDDLFITTWNISVKGDSVVIPVGNNDGMYTVDWGDGSTTTVQGDARHTYDLPGTYTVKISGDFAQIHLGAGDPFNAEQLQSLDQWGTIRWSTMESAFKGASNMTYEATDVPDLSNVKDMSSMFFDAYSFNGDISSWDVSNVTDMDHMFSGTPSFNQPLNDWDVSNVTDMSLMFAHARSFNQPLNDWDVSNVTDMSLMFAHARSFNQPLNDWDVSNVTDMSLMFSHARSFNQPLNDWDVSNVTDMSHMFSTARSFDQPLNNWDTSSVKTMSFMFSALPFNGDISSWDVSNVTDMDHMFSGAPSFNQPLNDWDVSNVTDMTLMFGGTDSFAQPLDRWDVSNVTEMHAMFMFSAFNHPLDSWDVSNVTDMSLMFHFSSFDQNLGNWYITNDDILVSSDDTPITTIRAQNEFLDGQNPSYMVVQKGDGLLFEMRDDALYYTMSEHRKPHYDITIVSTNGLVPVISRDITITVTDIDIQTDVMGTVFLDKDNDGVLDAGEDGLSGYTMFAVHPDKVMRTVTDADGTYSFAGLSHPVYVFMNPISFPPDHKLTTKSLYVVQLEDQTVTFDVGFASEP